MNIQTTIAANHFELIFAGSAGRIKHKRSHLTEESLRSEAARVGKRVNTNRFPPQGYEVRGGKVVRQFPA